MATTIVVGINGRERDGDALALAERLARLLEARLLMVNVHPHEPRTERRSTVALARSYAQDAQELLTHLRAQLPPRSPSARTRA